MLSVSKEQEVSIPSAAAPENATSIPVPAFSKATLVSTSSTINSAPTGKSGVGNGRPTLGNCYSTESYWDKRYQERACNFDWFFTYAALEGLIRNTLGNAKDAPCLHVGCGNSTIQEGMAADGFVHVTNIDISHVVIEQMRAKHDTTSSLQYEVVDCRDMHQFPDSMFGSVIDKGTLDAVLCAEGGAADVVKYLKEVDRVLAPGGIFLLVSLGAPASRTSVIKGPTGGKWETEVWLLPKPTEFLASEASFSGRKLDQETSDIARGMQTLRQFSKDDPLNMLGPFDMEKLKEMHPNLTAIQQHDFFFAYVCKKPQSAASLVSDEEQQHVSQPSPSPLRTLATPAHVPSFLSNHSTAHAACTVTAVPQQQEQLAGPGSGISGSSSNSHLDLLQQSTVVLEHLSVDSLSDVSQDVKHLKDAKS